MCFKSGVYNFTQVIPDLYLYFCSLIGSMRNEKLQ